MRIGIISDIHGNYVALRAVLEQMGQVDTVWCLGDLVGYGPQPNECVETISHLPGLCIPGNHDWGMLGRLDVDAFSRDARTILEWTQEILSPEHIKYLESLPMTMKAFGASFTLVHASPRNPMWEYLLDLFDAAECFQHFSTRYCFVGHTHVPLIFRDVGGVVKAAIPEPGEIIRLNVRPKTDIESESNWSRMIINPGSVGQPRDGDPRAAYMVLEVPDDASTPAWDWTANLSFHRAEYPVTETQVLMRSLAFPTRLVSRLSVGL